MMIGIEISYRYNYGKRRLIVVKTKIKSRYDDC